MKILVMIVYRFSPPPQDVVVSFDRIFQQINLLYRLLAEYVVQAWIVVA